MLNFQIILLAQVSRVTTPTQLIERLSANEGPIFIDNDMDFATVRLCTFANFSFPIYGQNKVIKNVYLICNGLFKEFNGEIYDLTIQINHTVTLKENFFLLAENSIKSVIRNTKILLEIGYSNNEYTNLQIFGSIQNVTVLSLFVNITGNVNMTEAKKLDVFFTSSAANTKLAEVELIFDPRKKLNTTVYLFRSYQNLTVERSMFNISDVSSFIFFDEYSTIIVNDVLINLQNVVSFSPAGTKNTGVVSKVNNIMTLYKNSTFSSVNPGSAGNLDLVIHCNIGVPLDANTCNSTLADFISKPKSISWTRTDDISFDFKFSTVGADEQYSTPRIQSVKPSCETPYGTDCFTSTCSNNCGSGKCVTGTKSFICECPAGLTAESGCTVKEAAPSQAGLIASLIIFVIAFVAILIVFLVWKFVGFDCKKKEKAPKKLTPPSRSDSKIETKPVKDKGLLDKSAPPLGSTNGQPGDEQYV